MLITISAQLTRFRGLATQVGATLVKDSADGCTDNTGSGDKSNDVINYMLGPC